MRFLWTIICCLPLLSWGQNFPNPSEVEEKLKHQLVLRTVESLNQTLLPVSQQFRFHNKIDSLFTQVHRTISTYEAPPELAREKKQYHNNLDVKLQVADSLFMAWQTIPDSVTAKALQQMEANYIVGMVYRPSKGHNYLANLYDYYIQSIFHNVQVDSEILIYSEIDLLFKEFIYLKLAQRYPEKSIYSENLSIAYYNTSAVLVDGFPLNNDALSHIIEELEITASKARTVHDSAFTKKWLGEIYFYLAGQMHIMEPEYLTPMQQFNVVEHLYLRAVHHDPNHAAANYNLGTMYQNHIMDNSVPTSSGAMNFVSARQEWIMEQSFKYLEKACALDWHLCIGK